jgi:HK97 family phage portal protein
MSLWTRLLEVFERREKVPDWVTQARSVSGFSTYAGIAIRPENAESMSAVFACVRVLAESVASLPLILYERLPDGGKRRATEHPLFGLLHDAPNDELTSYEWRATMMRSLLLWGNGYSEIEYDGSGRVVGLHPLLPNQMEVSRMPDTGELVYRYAAGSTGTVDLPSWKTFHVRGIGPSGVVGISPIMAAKQAIALSLSLEEYAARLFANDARPSIVLTHPKTISEEAAKRLRSSWIELFGGVSNSHGVAVLEEGLQVKEVGIPPEDAQFLQSRKFQKEEIASIYRVPLHMIGDLERATFSNIEQQSLEFVIYTLRPYLVNWEQAISRALLLPSERGRYFAEFLVDGLLRGDVQSRYGAYAVGRQWGWLSPNDVRRLENMDPIKGGDSYMVPLNMAEVGQGSRTMDRIDERSQTTDIEIHAHQHSLQVERRAQTIGNRYKLMKRYRQVFEETCSRIVKRECQDIRAAAKKYLTKREAGLFGTWLETFWDEQKEAAERLMTPVASTYGGLIADSVADELETDLDASANVERFMAAYVKEFAKRLSARDAERLANTLKDALEAGEDALEAVLAELDAWESQHPTTLALEESVRAGNAIAKMLYGMAGVAYLRWYTYGSKPCPYCDAKNGVVVGIDETFEQKGNEMAPDGAEPMAIGQDIGHPPLHSGCECVIGAG